MDCIAALVWCNCVSIHVHRLWFAEPEELPAKALFTVSVTVRTFFSCFWCSTKREIGCCCAVIPLLVTPNSLWHICCTDSFMDNVIPFFLLWSILYLKITSVHRKLSHENCFQYKWLLLWNSCFSDSAFSLSKRFLFAEFSIITSNLLISWDLFCQSCLLINQLAINSGRQLICFLWLILFLAAWIKFCVILKDIWNGQEEKEENSTNLRSTLPKWLNVGPCCSTGLWYRYT